MPLGISQKVVPQHRAQPTVVHPIELFITALVKILHHLSITAFCVNLYSIHAIIIIFVLYQAFFIFDSLAFICRMTLPY